VISATGLSRDREAVLWGLGLHALSVAGLGWAGLGWAGLGRFQAL
jgi:hypothetical protein